MLDRVHRGGFGRPGSLRAGLLFVWLVLRVPAAPGEEQGGRLQILDEMATWQRGAMNREFAANTQCRTADDLVERAQELRGQAAAEEEVRKGRYAAAGNLETDAAKLYVAAFTNFDRAAENWRLVAGLSEKAKEIEKKQRAGALMAAAKEQANTMCRRAAEAFEAAADAFSRPNANLAARAAQASERAAALWEKLAARR